jgi:hypothetical protein
MIRIKCEIQLMTVMVDIKKLRLPSAAAISTNKYFYFFNRFRNECSNN